MKYFTTRGDYLGKRLFAWNPDTGKCIQVVVSPGARGRGRGHMLGVYPIAEASFRTNYMWHLKHGTKKSVVPTTQKLFLYYFDQVTEKLKQQAIL